MLRSAILTTVVLVLLPAGASAQTWSAEEQAIIDFTNACWEMWSQEDVDGYLSDCWHEDITFWWSELNLPFGARWVGRVAPSWFSRHDWAAWDFQTHTVKVYGDAAVIQYQLMISEIIDGSSEFFNEGRTDFLVRIDGDWKVVAVHTHLAPASRDD
jgi:hypothetical protein